MVSNIVIDVQGFKNHKNKFIFKEIAVLYNLREFQHFVIKPPYDFSNLTKAEQRQANWLRDNYHGLKWNDGSISFNSVKKFLTSNVANSKIFVKGDEKKIWVSKLLEHKVPVYDLEKLGCPNLEALCHENSTVLRCLSHTGNCALQNIFILRHFIDNNLSQNKTM